VAVAIPKLIPVNNINKDFQYDFFLKKEILVRMLNKSRKKMLKIKKYKLVVVGVVLD